MERILEVSHLQVCFGNEVILQDLSFDLMRQETLVILGPNGAGKTVLFKALLGLISFFGRVDWKKNARIGYVPQRVPLSTDLPLTVADFFGLKGIAAIMTQDALQRVGITDPGFVRRRLGLVSSGQFQRVLIAWALADNPEVLLFDEPMAGVDVEGEETIHQLLRRAQTERNLAMILITHDLSTVYAEATHVLCLNQKVFCYGSPKEIIDPSVLQRVYGTRIGFFRHAHD